MKRLAQIVAVTTILAFPIVGMSAERSWYAGVTGGASSLRPETKNSPFKVDSSVSFGAGVFVGYDYSARFSFEAGYHYLGDATLSSANGKHDISYSALSVGGLMYVYGDDLDIAERNGFTGYVRLGLNSMSNSTSIPLEREDNIGILAGVGVEWSLTPRLNLRGEIASFDGDAQTARLAVLYRPNSNDQSAPVIRAPKAPAQVESTPTLPDNAATQEESAPAQEESTVAQQETAPTKEPTTEQSTRNALDSLTTIADAECVAPATNEPIDEQGCGLIGGLLKGVDFASGTANLTLDGSRLLDQLSENLMTYAGIMIEIQAHTESFGDEVLSNEIAKQRTLTVARHLIGRGVPVNRLKARAFGHAQPLAPDSTVAGRQQNNRIELRVLP